MADARLQPASGALLQSRIQRVLNATRLLSADLYEIFDRVYIKGQSHDSACNAMGLTEEQFGVRHKELLRSFKQSMPTQSLSAGG